MVMKNQNIFYRYILNLKIYIFEIFILKIVNKIEWILCWQKNLVKILILTLKMCDLAN